MCRWLAYSGPPIYLDRLIFRPENSLINQSLQALEGKTTTNGDGFGIGWYGDLKEPGVVRDVHPAWNDENLLSLAHQIRSKHFFAHVRAATGTSISRSNCHPFRFGKWLFMHNGAIGGYLSIRHALTRLIDPALYAHVGGATDSELFFYLLVGRLEAMGPEAAFGTTIAEVCNLMDEAGVKEPFRMTAALTDGEIIYALRYASDNFAPSLYYACGPEPHDEKGTATLTPCNSILVLSEPLDREDRQWNSVEPNEFLIAGGGGIAAVPFHP